VTRQEKSDAGAELKEELLKLHQQLLDRDDAFRAWDERVDALQREKLDLSQAKLDLSQRLARAEADIRAMQSTRLWRLGSRYWNTRDRVKRMLGRAG
jgi:hypothetical protein